MRILHISDLHRAGTTETLKAIWGGPQSALRKLPEAEQRFDLIVVSGDLSAAAQPAEYRELHEFTATSLLPLLRDPEARARVIFVPGNHDVDWRAEIGHPLQLADLLQQPAGSEQLARMLQRYREDPARSGLRQVISKYGHIEWIALDEARQGLRLANVQRFLDEFYGPCLREPGRGFDLVAAQEGLDWSAHVFPEDRIAVYGFNSCFLNDRYWTGAAISRESIANAAAHASEHAEGFLRIAVWHHGIHTDGYRPDYLNQADLGALIVAGFQVGFHGHLHKAGAQQLGWLTDRFVLVGTGSLGANQNHRPDAVGKQFSVVQLHPHQVHVQVYERTGDMAVYTRRPARTLPLGLHGEREPHEVSAGEHHRHAHVDRHGISTVEVRIAELRTPHPIQLAELSPPGGEALTEQPQRSPGFEVRQSTGQDGVIRFTLYPPDHRATDLTWSYHASNLIPLTQAEVPRYAHALKRGSQPGRYDELVLRAHTVRIPCRQLTLTFSFDEPVVDMDSVEKCVHRSVTHNGDQHWEWVESELQRCELIKRSDTEIALRIEAPIVGHRYAITYRPSRPGHTLDYTAGRVAARLLDHCIADRELGPLLSYQLAEIVSAALSAVFNASPAGVSWMGLLWDETQGRLLPAFGNFPSREWVRSYPWGTDVAGHAFRFNRPATWSRDTKHSKHLLHHLRPAYQHWTPEHDWIVCIPLVGDPQKNPLGVVQFEGGGKQSGLGDRLREFANAALAQAATRGSSWEAFQQTLSSAVNTGFWQACALADCLSGYRTYVHHLIASLELGGLPDAASLTDGSSIRP